MRHTKDPFGNNGASPGLDSVNSIQWPPLTPVWPKEEDGEDSPEVRVRTEKFICEHDLHFRSSIISTISQDINKFGKNFCEPPKITIIQPTDPVKEIQDESSPGGGTNV